MNKFLTMCLAMLLVQLSVFAQTRLVRGVVTDANGSPLQAISVQAKGTTAGTSTDQSGRFSFNAPAGTRTIVFSGLGLGTLELAIADEMNVSMTTVTPTEMETVTVQVPYGAIKKKSFTGAEATVTAATLNKMQNSNITKSAEGLVAGLFTTNGGGAPGSGATFRIRGIGSINASSAPLYVVNGVPYDGSITAINPDDVESFTILKDAAASALYGSRAANGVVMITTKRGRKGTPKVSFNVRQGFMNRLIPDYNKVNSQEYYQLFWEAYRNEYIAAGDNAGVAGSKASARLTGPNGLVYNAFSVPAGQFLIDSAGRWNTNARQLWNESWEDALVRTASRTNVTMNISGGGENSDFFLSAGYLNEDGITRNSGYKRYNTRLNFNAVPAKWLGAGINLDGALVRNSNLPSGGTSTTNPFYFTRQIGPIYPVYQRNPVTGAIVKDSLGNDRYDFGVPEQMGTRPYAGRSNIAATLALDDRHVDAFNGNMTGYVEFKFLKHFTLRNTLGATYNNGFGTTYQNSLYGDAAPSTPGGSDGGRSTKSSDRTFSLTATRC